VLQGQLTAAHEELSDARFRSEEQRAAAAAKEQQARCWRLREAASTRSYTQTPTSARTCETRALPVLLSATTPPNRPATLPPPPQLSADKLALEQQASALSVTGQRLERELAAAAAKAGQQEGQLGELYELCTSQQGARPGRAPGGRYAECLLRARLGRRAGKAWVAEGGLRKNAGAADASGRRPVRGRRSGGVPRPRPTRRPHSPLPQASCSR
jgi:hypothetical protein